MQILEEKRRFSRDIGRLSYLYIMAGIGRRLFVYPHLYKRAPEADFDKVKQVHTEPQLRACYLGTGEIGSRLAARLYAAPANTAPLGFPTGGQLQVCLFEKDFAEIGKYLVGRHLVFLAGSLDDRAFWLTRELISSNNPGLLITLAVSDSDKTVLRPFENEGCILLQRPVEIQKLALLILLFHSSLTSAGYICVDFVDYVYLLSGTVITPLTYEATIRNDAEAFAKFLDQNEANIISGSKLVCTVFTEHMEGFEERTGAVVRLLDEDADVIIHDNHELNVFQPDLYFKMQLFCAREAICHSYPQWPYFRI